MPVAAVVVRTKDRPRLLERALDDILAQTFTDWELVVVNDGGAVDDVEELLAARASAFRGRASVMHNPRSRGMESAANQGVSGTSAPYLSIHDDDDTWAPDFLETTVRALDEAAEAVAVAVNTEIVIESIEAGGSIVERERRPYPAPMEIVTLYDLLITNRVVPISLVIRRSVIEQVGGYDERLPVVGDWEMNMRLATQGDIIYVPGPPRAFWRQRPDSADSSANSVFAGADLHERFDRLVRDRALRERARAYGLGDLLYLSRHIQDVAGGVGRTTVESVQTAVEDAEKHILEEVGRRLDEIEARLGEKVRYYSIPATIRRNVRRALGPRKR
jgi:glycosyltransferase involved in cell wall biosynthesis